MKKPHYLTESDLLAIRRMIEVEGLQQWKVAEEIGVYASTIEKTCKRLGLKTQRTGPRSGPGHYAKWKGGRVKVKGYWYTYSPGHPRAKKGTPYVLEHRLLMEKKLGRYLDPKEVVHHIDGNRGNNVVENLIVFQTNGLHLKAELKGRVPHWTPEGLEAIREGQRQKTIRNRLRRDARRQLQAKTHPTG
jgi:hypothetical protein